MADVFISYCRSDKESLGNILREMTSLSLQYWLDESDIMPTMEFNNKILDGLATCKWFLVAMTPRSAASEYVKDELHWALSNRNGHIIPVMLESCEPATFHLRMMRIQYVNLTVGNEDGMAQLQRTFRLIKSGSEEGSLPLNARKIDSNLELLSLLLTFISRHHQKHIRNLLAQPGSIEQAYVGGHPVRRELRDLCNWGILNRSSSVKIGEQAQDGKPFMLSDVVGLTELGKRLAGHVS